MRRVIFKKLLISTGLSVLVFFSVSFVTFLAQIHTPFGHRAEDLRLDIGFPLTYYYEFSVDSCDVLLGWKLNALFADIIITWALTVVLYFLFTQKKLVKS